MKRPSFPTLLLALVPAFAGVPVCAQDAQTPTTVFPRQVEMVTVDVVVTDRDGNPVTDLKRGDFSVTEEKLPQTIQTFERITSPPLPSAPVERQAPVHADRPRLATNAGPPPPPGRTFVIVFDNMNLSPLNAQRAKAAVLAFIDRGLRTGDHVTLASTAGGAWWDTGMPEGRTDLVEMLKGLDARKFVAGGYDRLTDFEALRIYLYSDAAIARRVQDRLERYGVANRTETDKEREGKDSVIPGRIDLYVDNRAAETYLKVRSRNRSTLAALERILRPLAASRDRKAVVLVSEGFVFDPSEEGYRRVVETARRGNASLYFVDTRGLADLPGSYSAEFGSQIDEKNMMSALADTTQDSEGAVSLARDTGGFSVANTNDLETGIVRIGRESSSYYLLGYNPGDVPRNGRFRRIAVKVRRSGVEVRARGGYFAPSDAPATDPGQAKEAVDPEIQFGLDSSTALGAIPLRLTAYVLETVSQGRARVLVAADADVSKVDFEDVEGKQRGSLDTLAVLAKRETAEFYRQDQKVELERRPGPALGPSWYTLVREFDLPAGGFQAKLVVRDPASHRLGTVTLPFDVPPLDSFRITTPILSDTVQLAPNAPPSVVLLARRSFGTSKPLFCRFDVMNAKKDATQMPRVTAGHLLRRRDGAVVGHAAPTEIEPTSIGALSRLMQIPLAGLAPGDYELVLTAVDQRSGRQTSTVEPFTIVGTEGR